jgi:hypothetical protein
VETAARDGQPRYAQSVTHESSARVDSVKRLLAILKILVVDRALVAARGQVLARAVVAFSSQPKVQSRMTLARALSRTASSASSSFATNSSATPRKWTGADSVRRV